MKVPFLVKASRGLDLEGSLGFHLLDEDQTREPLASSGDNVLNYKS
jgi:hypothetical protein